MDATHGAAHKEGRTMRTVVETANVAAGETVHVFERAGLGKAPFRFVGMTESVFQSAPGAPVQPGSSCDYCAAGIRYVFWIKGADGFTFKVGCDCVRKTGDAGLRRAISAAEKSIRDAKTAKVRATKESKVAAAVAALLFDEATREAVASRPHPRGFVDRATGEPLTMLDWCGWMLTNAGLKGRTAVAEAIAT